MDIYPQDLGQEGYLLALHLRAQKISGLPRGIKPPAALTLATLTPLRRAWMRGSDVDDRTARYAQPAFALCQSRLHPFGVGFWALMVGLLSWGIHLDASNLFAGTLAFGLPSAMMYGAWLAAPRRLFRAMHEPLTEEELSHMMDWARDPLARDYLELARETVSMPSPAESASQKDVRAAIRALGLAIEGLPPQSPKAMEDAPDTMNQAAEQLALEAQTEADPVVAASLHRQSEALTRRAETLTRVAMRLRRNQTLRREVAGQIKSLQTSLAASGIGLTPDAGEFSALAGSIRRVAHAAHALDDSRAELEMALDELSPPTLYITEESLAEDE